MDQQIIVSGIQPSGELHIGNYLGAIKNWLTLQSERKYHCFFFIADLHSLTGEFDPQTKYQQIISLTRDLLALGLDPDQCTLFVQSAVPEHTELSWIFSTLTPMSELERMTQYKDKAEHQVTNVNVGLFTYPVLQAADILMYKADRVPVGEDQVQHVELTRVIGRKFNNKFGQTFPETLPLLTATPRVMSLTEPVKKMSKSHGPKSYLALNDPPELILEKIRKATADEIGVTNLLELHKLFDANGAATQKFLGEQARGTLMNVKLKDGLAALIANHFARFRADRVKISESAVVKILKSGAKVAGGIATETMTEVRKKVGIRD
ncbi:MAG: Tryptophan--tRNA ligase [Candidatus Magasanikbacteria bacterium]|nr:Tryptophan--tRNA ligase [Candidatus Magasanikbacteria bacterium]